MTNPNLCPVLILTTDPALRLPKPRRASGSPHTLPLAYPCQAALQAFTLSQCPYPEPRRGIGLCKKNFLVQSPQFPFFSLVFVCNRQILTQTLILVLTHFLGILKKFNGIYLSSILLYDQP